MEQNKWINDMVVTDTQKSLEEVQGETVYTLYQKDFLQMPIVDFSDLASLDPDIRALFN